MFDRNLTKPSFDIKINNESSNSSGLDISKSVKTNDNATNLNYSYYNLQLDLKCIKKDTTIDFGLSINFQDCQPLIIQYNKNCFSDANKISIALRDEGGTI